VPDDPRPGRGSTLEKRIRVARSTKLPAKKARDGSVVARTLLSDSQVLERLRLDDAALEALDACCTISPPRNSASIVSAIRTRLEFSQPKPATKNEHTVSGRIELVDPFAEKKP
jgi:hypothetical protein